MRDKNRIKSFCGKLREYWENDIPDWRFGQFMSNFLGFAFQKLKRDVFFIEDDEMLELLDEYFTKSSK